MWMILFLVLPFLGMVYVGWHLWLLLPLGGWWKAAIILLGVACCLSLFLDISGRLNAMPLSLAKVLYNIGTSSIIVLLYAVMLFLVVDVASLVRLVPREWVVNSLGGTLSCLGLLLAVFAYGFFNYKHKVRVPIDITTEKTLPRDYRIVMLTDLHLGYHNTRAELARWIDIVNDENPDVVLIAGDIIDISVRPLIEEGSAAEFHRLKAPVYACLGNHEYYSGTPEAQQFYKDARIHLLSDAATEIDNTITVIGRDDRTNRRRKSVEALMAAADKEKFSILLDHQPYDLERSEKAGIDFQLSGHTHRGQVWPISWVTDAMYECSWGEYFHGNTQYYVSSGIGIWGGRFRIGTQSEYVVATLRSRKKR